MIGAVVAAVAAEVRVIVRPIFLCVHLGIYIAIASDMPLPPYHISVMIIISGD